MRRSTKLIALIVMSLTIAGISHGAIADSDDTPTADDVISFLAASEADTPTSSVAAAWYDCIKRLREEAGSRSSRELCKSWTADGYTSELIALRIDDRAIPVIETRSDATTTGKVVIEVTGGPGGSLFYVDPDRREKLNKLRKLEAKINGLGLFNTYNQFLDRGITIASVGYWGTSVRTLNVTGEMELAMDDVRSTVDFYRDSDGADPPLILTSLGNHLALGALGQARLEQMQFLALVPVMDGLQHHLARFEREDAERQAKAQAKGEFYRESRTFNIYRGAGDSVEFDQTRMLPMAVYVPQFIGSFDYPWKAVTPTNKCSRVILGDRDPRTREYLAGNDDLPHFITVLPAEHDLFAPSSLDMELIFEEYADCLGEQDSPKVD